LRFTDKTFDLIKHGPTVVSAAHVGEPTLEDPKRTLAPEMTKQNVAIYTDAYNAGKPPAPADAVTPTGPNEPPRTDTPSSVPAAPLQTAPPSGGNSVGAEIVSAPAADPNAVIKPVGPTTTVEPKAEKPAEAPDQVNEVKPGSTPAASTSDPKKKKPKVDSDDESSSKKKKKKGLSKLNPF
jgi:outer membrane protein assembly factor BamD